MSELRPERVNAALQRKLEEAEQTVRALVGGEIDALLQPGTTPVLLQVAQAKLQANERLLRAVFDGAMDAMLIVDDDGRTVDANAAACALFGLTRERLLGRTVADFEDPELTETKLEAGPAAEARAEGYFRLRRADGGRRDTEYRTTPGILPGMSLAVLRDITQQQAAQASLEASQRSLEEAQAVAHFGNWTSRCVPDATICWSAECARIFGYAPGSTPRIGALFEIVHADDRERLRVAWERGVVEKVPFDSEHRLVLPNGETRWILTTMKIEGVPAGSSGSSPSARAGEADRAFGVVQDITERKRGVEKLLASELRYRRIVDNTSEGVWMYDAAGITTFMNPPMLQMLGYSLAEAIGQPVYTFMDKAAVEEGRARVERRKRGVAERGDFRLTRRDGTDVWVSLHSNPLLDQAGNFESALVLVADNTERRRADEARNRLASIVESSDDAIISRGLDGIIRTWNHGAERLTLYAATEAIGKPIAMLYAPEDAARLDERRAEVDAGRKLEQFEMVAMRKDGSSVDVSITSSVLKDDAGTRIGASIIARNISERKRSEAALRRSEEQLRQAQKLEAIGSLAGGIAHDFNNVLSVILSYTTLMLEVVQPSDPLCADLTEVQTAGMRANRLVRQLLAFSRQQIFQAVVLDLNQILNGIEGMLLRILREDIPLSLLMSPVAGKIYADPGQIEQVIMNLVVNARDAMPNGGTLSIETTILQIDEAHAAEHPGATAGPHVLLAVIDTGTGMDAATMSHIFEPFFTTKEKEQGTGLGLSTVYGIVQQSGGHLSVQSEVGKGTAVNVYLPLTDRALPAPVTAHGSAVNVGGTETILVVEDEEQVRSVMRQILRKQGYNVLEAQNAGDAFLLCEQFSGTIHLLLTDVVMPRMSGRQLAERLTQGRPEMRVLYVSGYTDDTMVQQGVPGAGIHFLQKPILPGPLSRKVRHVLDAPGHPDQSAVT